MSILPRDTTRYLAFLHAPGGRAERGRGILARVKRLLSGLRAGWAIAGLTFLCLLLADAALVKLLPEAHGLDPIDSTAEAPGPSDTEAMAGAPWADSYYAELKRARHTRWEPYSYWRREAFAGEYINIDADGIRKSWAPDDARLKVWMFGGSTVWGTGARDDYTLPSALARALAGRGVAAEVVNLGETGYVSGQQLASLLSHLRDGGRPDAVVFYDGVNDVYAALQREAAGAPQNEAHRERDFRVTDGVDNWLEALPRTLEGVQRLAARLGPAPARRPVRELAAEVVAAHRANVRAVQALGREFGFETWFFWQPHVFAKRQRSPTEERIYRASLQRHKDLQLAADATLAAAGDPAVIDLSTTFATTPDALYLDFCHLSEDGNARVAERIAAYLAGPLARLAGSD